jgi:hypothetical protein
MRPYEWRKWTSELDERWVGLLPVHVPNNYSMERIASIYRRSDGKYVAAYFYPYSTGNKRAESSHFKTLRGAQRWIEKQLDKFWEPPTIANAISA